MSDSCCPVYRRCIGHTRVKFGRFLSYEFAFGAMTLSFWQYPIFVCSFTYVSVEVSETLSWMLNVLFPQEVLFERYPFFFSLVALFYWTSMRILMARSWLDVGSMLVRWLWWWWCVFVGSLLAQGWLDLGSRFRLAQCMTFQNDFVLTSSSVFSIRVVFSFSFIDICRIS